jgi:peptidoglycan/LPS O-acetylase OafA/YrhL
MSTTPQGRLALIDALKAFGSQFIVLHHLAYYGPMTDWTQQRWPALVNWFSQDARMAVQVFLVVAGFLSAHSLAPQGVLRVGQPLAQIWKRYVRVALPYLAALLVSVVCTEWARLWMTHDSMSDLPTGWQWFTHVLLLHGLLGVDSISAGVWYVAIDFQLYVLLLLLLWLPSRWRWAQWIGGGLVLVAVLVSLFHFNRDAVWDAWALYFFGAYGLGVLTYWAMRPDQSTAPWVRWAWVALCLCVVLALLLHFRARIALALAVAIVLGVAHRWQWLRRWPKNAVVAYLGQISYSVFLLNFPVALVVNAWFTRYMPADVWWQTLGVLVAWLACNVAGMVFYHGVEQKLSPAAVRNAWIRLTQLERKRNADSGL